MKPLVFDAAVPAPAIRQALTGARFKPYWLDDAAASAPSFGPGLGHPASYDLVVVGGGFTGLWSALLARQRDPGLRVALLEAQTIGWAASGRNGGFVESSLTHGQENGRARWPEEYDELERLGLANLDEIERAVAELGIDCDFERPGALTVATEPYQAAALLAGQTLATEPTASDVVHLDSAAVRAQVNSPTYLAGVWDKRSNALVNPAKLAFGLAQAAAAAGVDIFEHSAVRGLSRAGGAGSRLRLATDRSAVLADRVILATNVFPSLLARYRLHTVPVYDYALMTEPLSAAQMEELGWKHRQGVSDSSSQFHYYRLTSDNRILWGGYDAIYYPGRKVKPAQDIRPQTWAKLAGHFLISFPYLEGIRFTHRWGGAIDTCSRFCAFFARAYGGQAAYAAGFTGLGVGAARFAAKVMLDLTAGVDSELTRPRLVRELPLPFPPEPFATIGIQATRWAINRADHNQGRRGLLLKALDAAGLGFDS
ncbi:MAG: FAD-binding oxidoreductase [Bifidobacteriaceae bacterium]|jgi:glycine/D-amino acid oxidase-like deaminating enzyme|nr:FAD-binding oxidoreductase [Bifidobacteriaceae bacterium]